MTTAGFRWFVTFIKDCTRVSWVYMLKHKKDVLPVFHKFITLIQTQFSMDIKTFWSDNEGEYISQEFR
jgi:transposase InsO family protein